MYYRYLIFRPFHVTFVVNAASYVAGHQETAMSQENIRATFVMRKGSRDLLKAVAHRYGVSQSERRPHSSRRIVTFLPFGVGQ